MAEDKRQGRISTPAILSHEAVKRPNAMAEAATRLAAGSLLTLSHFILYFVVLAPGGNSLVARGFLRTVLEAVWIAPAMLIFTTLRWAGVEWHNGLAFAVLAINSVLYGFGITYFIFWVLRWRNSIPR